MAHRRMVYQFSSGTFGYLKVIHPSPLVLSNQWGQAKSEIRFLKAALRSESPSTWRTAQLVLMSFGRLMMIESGVFCAFESWCTTTGNQGSQMQFQSMIWLPQEVPIQRDNLNTKRTYGRLIEGGTVLDVNDLSDGSWQLPSKYILKTRESQFV